MNDARDLTEQDAGASRFSEKMQSHFMYRDNAASARAHRGPG